MNVERLKMWRDALIEADKKGRVFDIRMWRRATPDSPCGFAACAAGDLAMYGPAQDLGMGFSDGGIIFVDPSTMELEHGSDAVCAFLGVQAHLYPISPDEVWVRHTISSSNEGNVYRDPQGRPLHRHSITRAMVLARIEAKIAKIER